MITALRRSSHLALACTLLSLTACGGGSGGGGETGPGRSADTGIRVLHAAIDAFPVDINAVPDTAAEAQGVTTPVRGARFAGPQIYGALQPGTQVIETSPAQSRGAFSRLSLNVARGQRFSLLLHGDRTTTGLRTSLFEDLPPRDLDSGQGGIRFVNATTGVGGMHVIQDSGTRLADGVAFGAASGYARVPAGSISFAMRRVSDGRTFASGSATIPDGGSVTVVAAGELDYFVILPVYPD